MDRSTFQPPRLNVAAKLGLLVLGVGTPFAVQFLLLPEPSIAPFVFFYFGVTFTGYFGGPLLGSAAILLSAALANYFFIEPYRSPSLTPPALVATSLFVLAASATLTIASLARRTVFKLATTTKTLREQAAAKNKFLAILSHELRNPLAPIMNALYLLENAPPGSEKATFATEVISRQSKHLARLIDELLDVTRIERGKMRLQCATVDVGQHVRKVAGDTEPILAERGIALDLRIDAAPLFVFGDSARLWQVFANLLQNAAKFTSPGGRVVLSLSRDAANGQAVASVKDTGIGMTPETVRHLFQPFAQAEQTLARSQGGLGLGLALARGVVELHGGTIEARSAGLEQGSEFIVRLPLSAAAAGGPTPVSPNLAKPRSKRVLLIEDNRDSAETLAEALRLNGHEVDIAFDGPSGIELARRCGPEVVLCDIGLPSISGYEVARQLKGEPGLRGVRLVALTSYARPEDIQAALQAGFSHHIAKPPDFEALQRVLAA